MDKLFQKLHMPADLAIEFMATFSRMEYALKSTGYALGDEGKVEPAWDRFANEIDSQFDQLEDEELVEAKNFLLTYPPRKQVFKNGQVIFQDQAVDKKQNPTQQVIRFVRTVRNNRVPRREVSSNWRNRSWTERRFGKILAKGC